MGVVEKILAGGAFLIAIYLVLSHQAADQAILQQGGNTGIGLVKAFQGR